ncbi:MAG: hypothetical protein OQK94_03700 [Gammaproteobacteria bacterium]|nr:hypothetical protein [Gammaproteobacteria bacterium]MCW8841424.1 hypothetical protein [Gammaproteobacteria bacterium]MCW8928386.1 hypothetical protein [Gammaproteobacteria bacterium]MCW8957961.1 hypothetical protein [Gammaproteobacteria bacterium]MCW8973959.1 hypothetical protein [Gammaproteobacteria bacterium]
MLTGLLLLIMAVAVLPAEVVVQGVEEGTKAALSSSPQPTDSSAGEEGAGDLPGVVAVRLSAFSTDGRYDLNGLVVQHYIPFAPIHRDARAPPFS